MSVIKKNLGSESMAASSWRPSGLSFGAVAVVRSEVQGFGLWIYG